MEQMLLIKKLKKTLLKLLTDILYYQPYQPEIWSQVRSPFSNVTMLNRHDMILSFTNK